MHACMIWYLASRACTYRFCKLASMSGWLFSTLQAVYWSGPAPISAPGSLGTHPKPRDRTSASYASFDAFAFRLKRKKWFPHDRENITIKDFVKVTEIISDKPPIIRMIRFSVFVSERINQFLDSWKSAVDVFCKSDNLACGQFNLLIADFICHIKCHRAADTSSGVYISGEKISPHGQLDHPSREKWSPFTEK